jgi:conjugal transfer pilin signal peptidase TrbI
MRYKHNRAAIAVIAVSALLLLVLPFYSVRISDSRTDCLPYKLWFIDKTQKTLKAGDFIAFRTPSEASYVPEYKMWVKIVFAAGEGKVQVTPAQPGETKSIVVNGVDRSFPMAGHVNVRSGDREDTFSAFAADTSGKPLSIIDSQEIRPGHYYVYATSERSYDSRYWGLVRQDEVLGKAYPIF